MKIPQLGLALAILQSMASCGLPEGASIPGRGRVSNTTGVAAVAGNYILIDADGLSLPFRYQSARGCAAQIIGGSLSLRANGTFQRTVNREENCEGEVKRETGEEDGDFDVRRNRIRFEDQFDDGEDEEGDGYLEGNTIYVPMEDFGKAAVLLTFRR